MKRREFIQLISASAVSIPAMKAMAGVLPESSLPVHLVHDTAVQAGRAELELFAVKVDAYHPISGDVTGLWSERLDLLWRKHSIVTVGVTRHAEYFVLRTLARDHRYCMISERNFGDHVAWMIAPQGYRHG